MDPVERLRRDMAAYQRIPQTRAEVALADCALMELDDETDWEALYAEVSQ